MKNFLKNFIKKNNNKIYDKLTNTIINIEKNMHLNTYYIYIYNYNNINLLTKENIIIDNISIHGKELFIKELDEYFMIITGDMNKVEIINDL